MTVLSRLALGTLAAVWLAGCQQAALPLPTSVPPTRTAVTSPPPTATPAATANLTLDKVGAASSPSGYTAFAVVSNPTAQTARDVKVEIAELNASGQVLMHRGGSIQRIGAGQREALAVTFPVGRTLPAQFSGTIGDVRWSTDSSPEIAQVAGASFVQDARTPTVRVHVVNNGQGPARMILVAVCWDGAGNIRGGGTRTTTVAAGADGHDVTVDVWIVAVPTRCDGYGVAAS
jgi:hypothetical protein